MSNSGEHALRNGYKIWYMLRGGKIGQDKGEYEKGFKTIGTFHSVEQFWNCYSHITRADALPNLDLHMFKEGIKPMWEDAANKIGGKAMVRVHKSLAPRCWEAVLLGIIGEQFGVGDEITGAVLSIKARSHVKISVWNRTASNTAAIEKIRAKVRVLMELPDHVQVDYSPHDPKATPKPDGWRGSSSPRMRAYEPDRLGPRGSSRGSPRGRNERPYYMRGSNQYMGSGSGIGNFGLQQQPQQQPQQQQQRSYTWGTRSWGQNQT